TSGHRRDRWSNGLALGPPRELLADVLAQRFGLGEDASSEAGELEHFLLVSVGRVPRWDAIGRRVQQALHGHLIDELFPRDRHPAALLRVLALDDRDLLLGSEAEDEVDLHLR